MRLTLAKRVVVTVVGVICLTVLSSMVALLSSWHIGRSLHVTVSNNVSSVRAAEELEIALLEQRGFVSSYLLDDGNGQWLEGIEEKKQRFLEWLDEARRSSHTDDEDRILSDLWEVYQQYDTARDKVVELYDCGEAAAAERLLLGKVNDLFSDAYDLCERFINANHQYVAKTEDRVRSQIRQVTWAVATCVLLTVGLGAALLWLFFSGVFFPIRAMVADARRLVGDVDGDEKSNSLPTDELRAVGIYLKNLMSDVADARTTLEHSRQELRDAEKLASVGRLAAGVAHEIRSPLTSMKMWLFSLQKEVGGDPARDRKFEIVAEEVRRLEDIVRDFLEFSRPRELNARVLPIAAVLDRTLELVGARMVGRKIALVREDAADLPPVLADAEQLRQVLINLLNNAVEAAGERGRIRVAATAESAADGRRMVVVRVSDDGPGMSNEVRPRIFEPFFTTRDDGTGLGLCIAAQIMARHEGRLVLESSAGAGTTFAIHIPAAPEEPA